MKNAIYYNNINFNNINTNLLIILLCIIYICNNISLILLLIFYSYINN